MSYGTRGKGAHDFAWLYHQQPATTRIVAATKLHHVKDAAAIDVGWRPRSGSAVSQVAWRAQEFLGLVPELPGEAAAEGLRVDHGS